MDTIVQRALLESRQEKQCGSDSASEDYNMSLHIFAIFLIMTCGTTAAVFPTIVRAYPWLAISKHVLFISRHFGTGVLIALAFVHLLPTAFENLWDDCLSHFWTDGYDAMPGFIAMLAALAIMLVEMGFTCKGFRQAQTAGALEERVEGIQLGGTAPLNEHEVSPPEECKARGVTSLACANGDQCSADLICPCDTPEQGAPTARSAQISNDNIFSDKVTESSLESLPAEKKERRMILQCLLLEAGILFHSVFIGLSISLSTGTTFIALMIAISFHQIFEGLALGARIAAVPSFRVSNPKPWVMSVAVSNVLQTARLPIALMSIIL
ncbi:hypothetical protein ACLMJK_003849 [Lecanora helva]